MTTPRKPALNSDVVVKILQYLPPEDTLNMRYVSKSFRADLIKYMLLGLKDVFVQTYELTSMSDSLLKPNTILFKCTEKGLEYWTTGSSKGLIDYKELNLEKNSTEESILKNKDIIKKKIFDDIVKYDQIKIHFTTLKEQLTRQKIALERQLNNQGYDGIGCGIGLATGVGIALLSTAMIALVGCGPMGCCWCPTGPTAATNFLCSTSTSSCATHCGVRTYSYYSRGHILVDDSSCSCCYTHDDFFNITNYCFSNECADLTLGVAGGAIFLSCLPGLIYDCHQYVARRELREATQKQLTTTKSDLRFISNIPQIARTELPSNSNDVEFKQSTSTNSATSAASSFSSNSSIASESKSSLSETTLMTGYSSSFFSTISTTAIASEAVLAEAPEPVKSSLELSSSKDSMNDQLLKEKEPGCRLM